MRGVHAREQGCDTEMEEFATVMVQDIVGHASSPNTRDWKGYRCGP
jgi:hypothetical protein